MLYCVRARMRECAKRRRRCMKTVDTGHIVVDPEVLGGEPHIVGHRIGVSDVAIWVIFQHESPETIANEFKLTLGEVHAALAYYYDHQDEIDRASPRRTGVPTRWLASIRVAGVWRRTLVMRSD